MTGDETGVLQNDPNRGLRDRIDPEDAPPKTSRDTLILALHDLHEVARERLATPEIGRRARRSRSRVKGP
jgi:hypothetical protein